MKKFFIYISFGVFVFLLTATVASAAFGRSFGGKITGSTAFDIEEAESAGYTCPTKGKTVQVKTKNGSEGYYIPPYVLSATRRQISTNQSMLFISPYSKTVITCTKQDSEGNTSVKTIYLKDIKYYGN